MIMQFPNPYFHLLLLIVRTSSFSTPTSSVISRQVTLNEKDVCNYSECQSRSSKCYLHNDCFLKRLNETTNALMYCRHRVTNIELASQGISYLCPHALSQVSPHTIDLSDNVIPDIPESFFSSATSVGNLSFIKLNGNLIKSLYRSHFSGMFRLRHLDISDNSLGYNEDLPEDVFLDLFMLQSLDLSRNFVRRVPNIDKLIFLKCFNISNNELTELPESFLGSAIHSFPYLTSLDVSKNPEMYTVMPSYLFDKDLSSNASVLLQNLNHFHFDEDAIQFSGCNDRFVIWSNTNCFDDEQAAVPPSYQMVTPYLMLIALATFLVASVFIVALVCLVVRRKRKYKKLPVMDYHSMGYMKVNRNVSSFVEHITPLHGYPEPYGGESVTSTQANSRDFKDSQSEHLLGEASSQLSECLGSSHNLAREAEGRKLRLEQKIRRRKKTHLKQLRSFSCNDIPKIINEGFSL